MSKNHSGKGFLEAIMLKEWKFRHRNEKKSYVVMWTATWTQETEELAQDPTVLFGEVSQHHIETLLDHWMKT